MYLPNLKLNRIRHDLSDKEKGSSDLCNIENLAAPIIDAALLIDFSLPNNVEAKCARTLPSSVIDVGSLQL